MNAAILSKLVRTAPYALAIFSIFLMAHGLHHVSNGDPGGQGPPNVRYLPGGDPGGQGPPN